MTYDPTVDHRAIQLAMAEGAFVYQYPWVVYQHGVRLGTFSSYTNAISWAQKCRLDEYTVRNVFTADAETSGHAQTLDTVDTATSTPTFLDDRVRTHGEFLRGAKICCTLQHCMQFEVMSLDLSTRTQLNPNWVALAPDMQMALINIAMKQSRILNGNPCEPDHWEDIAGYAMLVAKRLKKEKSQ